MFAMAIVGTLVLVLYGALTTSTSWVRLCQENQTATQIMAEKLDTIRLYNWDQLYTSNGFIVTNFVVGIDPLTNSTPYYTGRLEIAKALPSGTEAYKDDLLQVTVTVQWVGDRRLQTRSMSTFVTSYGIQALVNR